MKKMLLVMLGISLLDPVWGLGQNFANTKSKTFKTKKILLFEDNQQNKLIFYKTDLALNTDGSPTSYHPFDLRADSIANNLIINAVSVYRNSDSFCISIPSKDKKDYSDLFRSKVKKTIKDFTEAEIKAMKRKAYKIFEGFRDSDYTKVEDGYTLIWENVLVEKNGKPCIFQQGPYKGFFASQTAVNNGPLADKGECDCKHYLNAKTIPAMVLPKGDNALRKFNAAPEDLVIAYNLKNQKLVYAIIGDTGPTSNLGEGNILMNQRLKDVASYPSYRPAINKALVIGDSVLITIIPNSKKGSIKPFTEENIKKRGQDYLQQLGFTTEQSFISFILSNQSKLL
jgi:hypothetical protein